MSSQSSGPPAKKRRTDTSKKPPMHSGRWTPEEEAYVEEMISQFSTGQLPIGEGTTLRSFLAKMLNCNPKRVSKKYDGNPIYNGKAAYVRSRNPLPAEESAARQENLLELERKFREALMTMQRVESRLQTLTSHLMPPAVATVEPSTTETATVASPASKIKTLSEEKIPPSSSMITGVYSAEYSSSSAVSSLTDDEEEKTAAIVSDELSEAKKPAAATSAEEEAASQVLLQLNASVKPLSRVATAAATAAAAAAATATVAASPATNETVVEKINRPQVDGLNKNNTSLASVMAANSASLQQKSSNSGGGELQALIQSLQGIRQKQQQQEVSNAIAPGPSAPSSLQSLLGVQSLSSPLTQPQNAQQNLQSFMQTVQQHQQQQRQPSLRLQEIVAQTNRCSDSGQQPQHQMDLHDILQTLYQHQQQAPNQAPELNTQALLEAATRNMSAQPTRVQPEGNELLQQVLKQIAPNNVAPQPAQQHQQPTDLTVLQSLVSQQQQPPAQVLQHMFNQQQQQQDGGSMVASFVNQLIQNKVQQQQQQQQQGNNVQVLLQSLSAARNNQAQGAPKALGSHQAVSGEALSQQASLQALLMQLQTQNNTTQHPSANQFQLPRM